MHGYYFITDSHLSRAGNASDVRNAVAAGVRVVQFRTDESDEAKILAEAANLRTICHPALLIINNRVDISVAVGADGVHLGQADEPLSLARERLGPDKIIGVTVHTVAEARLAAAEGANYLGVSPIYTTQTKRDAGPPAGIELIRRIKRVVQIPLVAIGGIDLANAPAVIAAGADALCAISSVVTRGDVRAEIEKFQHLFR